jgi:hypothetical protein
MATTELHAVPASPRRSALATAAGRRCMLVLAALAAIAAAALLGRSNPGIAADPELAFVLRGMGLIKLAIATLAIALVWWRAGQPVPSGRILAYLACAALLAAAATLVLKLAVVGATSVVSHATLLAMGVMALGDDAIAKGALKRRQ